MRRIIIFVISITCSFSVIAQQQTSRAELESRRKQIIESLQETENQLAATKKDKSATMGQLRALQNKLAERQRLIRNINDEIGAINNNIQMSSLEVTDLRHKLELMKIRYAQSVRYAYQNRSSYNMLAFIFSASDYNDAVRRMKYLKKFRDYRKEQVEQIRNTQEQIEKKIGVLNNQKQEKDVLLNTEVHQQQVIAKEKNETDAVVRELKGKEKELMKSIERNKTAAKKLDRAISEIIRREIELARKKAEEEERRKAALAAPSTNGSNIKVTSTTVPTERSTATSATRKPSSSAPSYKLSLTPEVAALSNNFQANKGKLPWPVDKGFIAEGFGRHPHAVAEKVMIENDGLEIQTAPGAQARAVFEGTVGSVLYIPGMGQSVLVNHGQYFTLYSRLTNVNVKKGDKVNIKQNIGTVILNDENIPMLHFELWRVGSNNVPSPIDPATWIAR